LKVIKLKKVEQESKRIKEFVQKFKRAVRESRYEKRLLIEEFKKEMIRVIRKNLIKAEYTSRSIK